MTVSCPSASKSLGRPLAAKTIAIRSAVLELTDVHSTMTVRQIFYALEVRGVVPKDESGYRSVQAQVLRMRREGLLPWQFVSDSTRWQRKPATWDSVEDALDHVKRTYRRNLWASQRLRVEVWMEKDALAGVVMEATAPWDVALMVSRGTASATFLYEAAQEAKIAYETAAVETMVFALYDQDAAGRRASRAIERGLREHAPNVPIEFRLIAVTDHQVDEWQLPTRPAKKSDPEAEKFEGDAVELDAISPDKLISLVETAITTCINPKAWAIEREYERSERELLERMVAA